MKKMVIYEPAMCCATGVCGPSVDPELLRISTVLNNLKNNGIQIERYNLANNPQVFVDNKEINKLLNNNGIDILPVTMVDGSVVKIKAYPTNEEISKFLGIPEKYIKGTVARTTTDSASKTAKSYVTRSTKTKGCGSDCG